MEPFIFAGVERHPAGPTARIPPQMPWPRVVVIEFDRDSPGGFFLNRWAEDGTFAGDTWHRTLDEAKEQAVFELAKYLREWRDIPPNVRDTRAYALAAVARAEDNEPREEAGRGLGQ